MASRPFTWPRVVARSLTRPVRFGTIGKIMLVAIYATRTHAKPVIRVRVQCRSPRTPGHARALAGSLRAEQSRAPVMSQRSAATRPTSQIAHTCQETLACAVICFVSGLLLVCCNCLHVVLNRSSLTGIGRRHRICTEAVARSHCMLVKIHSFV